MTWKSCPVPQQMPRCWVSWICFACSWICTCCSSHRCSNSLKPEPPRRNTLLTCLILQIIVDPFPFNVTMLISWVIAKEDTKRTLVLPFSNAIGRRSNYLSLNVCFHYVCKRLYQTAWHTLSKIIKMHPTADIWTYFPYNSAGKLVTCPLIFASWAHRSDRGFCHSQLLPLGQWCWRSSKLATQCIERKPRISSWSIGTRTTKGTTTCSHQSSKE